MYGEVAVTDQMCQKWFVKFCADNFSLDSAPKSGRPIEVDSNQFRTLIGNHQTYTTWEIADILKISKSRVEIMCTNLVMLIALTFGFHIS